MDDFRPAWLSDELTQALAALGGQNQRKKRTTILRLAEARATGRIEADVFKLPGCCSRVTWYGPYRDGAHLPGWRDDPAVQGALEAATKRALWYQDQAEARRIAKRQEDVARARDKLADLAPLAALKLGALLGADNVETARKAANDILDRADEALASKATVYEKGDNVQRVAFDLDGLPVEILRLLADGGSAGETGGGSEGETKRAAGGGGPRRAD
jgi:hypothetical protein